jgi:PKD domain
VVLVKRIWLKIFAIVISVAALLSLGTPAALAQPANDDFANATVITGLPFSDVIDNTQATLEPGEPFVCGPTAQTVWYSITPSTTQVLRADTLGTNFFPNDLAVYRARAPGFGGLDFVGCAFSGDPIRWAADAGAPYYLQAGSFHLGGGTLQVNVEVVPSPPNDNFADATSFSAVPFSDDLDLSGATVESGEPSPSCSGFPPQGTAWYAFTPLASGTYTGGLSAPGGFGFIPEFGIFAGTALSDLTEVACFHSDPIALSADAGTTYFIQVGNATGAAHPAVFSWDLAPPPTAAFGFFPSDPSSFDTIQFFDSSVDPVRVGIKSHSWDFGDGSTATGCCPTHRYTVDGEYEAGLTVTTFDGRTASTSQAVQVRTHDVAITRLLVPQAASAGQTRSILVGVNNRRYVETVQVELFKGVPGGFLSLGVLTQSVPVRVGNRTTSFGFNYTFTSDDAGVGQVTFKAVANILGARDALSTNNEAIASPTKVSG